MRGGRPAEVREWCEWHLICNIKWFGKILCKNPKVEVTEFSDLYPNKGTKKFHRAYVEVRKSNVKEQ